MRCKTSILRLKSNVIDHRKIKLITIINKTSRTFTHAPRNRIVSFGLEPGANFSVPELVRN